MISTAKSGAVLPAFECRVLSDVIYFWPPFTGYHLIFILQLNSLYVITGRFATGFYNNQPTKTFCKIAQVIRISLLRGGTRLIRIGGRGQLESKHDATRTLGNSSTREDQTIYKV